MIYSESEFMEEVLSEQPHCTVGELIKDIDI